MIIPWGTDAPIYHRPIATVVLIVVNVVVFLAFPSADHREWALVLGEGIHPLQWVTNLFMHLGIVHLIGNMIFLWAFGIIVEGQLGAAGFLLVYLAIGVAESAVLQVVSHPAEPVFMLGASGVIYGLMAMCLVWAPRNDLNCLAFFRVVPFDVDIPILWFAILYIGLEVFETVGSQFSISGALAHAGGAVAGFVLGVALLKGKLVDCENWDLFSVLEGRQGRPRKRGLRRKRWPPPAPRERAARDRPARKSTRPEERKISFEDPAAAAVRKLRGHLELGEIEAALAVYQRSRKKFPDWPLPEPDWLDLIKALIDQKAWDDAIAVMNGYVEAVEAPSPRIRLKLAQLLMQKQERPARALRMLASLPEGSLPDSLESIRRQLVQQAEQMREEGVLELDDET
jgi:membrane associated rhomboid family serine protease